MMANEYRNPLGVTVEEEYIGGEVIGRLPRAGWCPDFPIVCYGPM